METRANYAIVGFFTVLIIAAAFGFVYWMANYGRGGQMAPLLVRIPGSANGLSVGSPVRFNGIQVGAVRTLTIDKSNPNFVVASADVRADAPVYKTTKAILEIQGLTGSAYIELSGGAVEGPNLLEEALRTGEPAVLEANPSSVTNILSTADKILQKVNDVVDQLDGFAQDARGPLTATIQNTRKFSQALADNSEGIDKFLGSISQLSDTIHNLSGRLDSTLASVQHLVQAVDPQKVDDILSNTDRATKQLADASATVQKTLDAFRQTAETYRAVGQKAQKTLDRVDALMAAVDPKKVGSTVDDVAAASAAARQTLGQIAQVTAEFDKHTDDIDKTLTNIRQMSDKLNAASSRVDEVLSKVSGFLGDSKASSVIADAKATLKSYRQLADNLNSHIGPIAANFQQFSNNGLKDVVALINQMRQAVAQIQDSVSTFQQNPQRLIFGGPDVKQYNGDRTRR